jgi:hypothetical protein
MPVSTATNVILAAGPTVVAIGAIGSTVWQQRRSFRHEREMADLADIRKLFDEIAVALEEASNALLSLESSLSRYGAAFRKEAPSAMTDAGAAFENLQTLGHRLSVRLPADHAAVEAFGAAFSAGRRAMLSMPPEPFVVEDPEAFQAGIVVRDAAFAMAEPTADFMRAANEAVGARLPD